MKAKSLVLVGAALLLTSLPASAQLFGRGRASRAAVPATGYTAPYPYGTGYNNSGYGNQNGTNQFGTTNPYGYNRFGQPNVMTAQNALLSMPNAVVPASGTTATSGRMGLKITELSDDGPAKDAGLDTGDVILSVDGKMTQTFSDMRAVLMATDKKEVKVEFWDASAGKMETKKVMVKDTKIGVTVDETMVK